MDMVDYNHRCSRHVGNLSLNKLKRKLEKQEQEARFINWRLWSKTGAMPDLDLTTWDEIFNMVEGRLSADEIDAMRIEYIVSTLDIAGRRGFNLGELWAFCLRVEYLEYGRPIEERAKHVSRKFNRPCGKWAFYKHLTNGKNAVIALAGPL